MTEPKLPVKQLVILSICRFAEPVALTSVSPYLPEMMESFGVPVADVARWAGISSAIFSMCQAFTGLFFGALSDRYGRKPIILVGLFNTMLAMLLFGASTSLPMALVARAFGGLSNGNVGILRTMVAELCPWKLLQPRAFSIMPLVFTLGSVAGPVVGGLLSNPYQVDPRKPHGSHLLERFPYLLPNIVAAALFTLGIIVGWLFLQETLERRRHHRDLGLRTGAKLTAFFQSMTYMGRTGKAEQADREPLLGRRKVFHDETEQTLLEASEVTKNQKPGIWDVLTYQTTLNLVVYTCLAFYTMAYDQLLPVFMHYPSQSFDDPNMKLPLKFAGGFGIDSRRIGAIFTFMAVSSTLVQFFLFPPIARYLGVLTCLRVSFLIFPFVYLVTPLLALIPDHDTKQVAMVGLLMIRGVAGSFSFPTSTIMLTNSAPSLRVLGTINGLATSVSAVGRSAGPFLGGGLFTWGVKRGYIIVPFWTLSAIAFLASIPTFWLVEEEGFGDDPDEDEERIEPTADEDLGQATQRPDEDAIQSESEFGGFEDEPMNPLTYTSTHSSAAMASESGDGGSLERRRSSNALSSARSQSQGRKPVLRRKSSIPIGLGPGFRRLSSNLGATGIGGAGARWEGS